MKHPELNLIIKTKDELGCKEACVRGWAGETTHPCKHCLGLIAYGEFLKVGTWQFDKQTNLPPSDGYWICNKEGGWLRVPVKET